MWTLTFDETGDVFGPVWVSKQEKAAKLDHFGFRNISENLNLVLLI